MRARKFIAVAAVVSAIGFGSDAASAAAQTVQVGTQTVTVPSSGQITVDGQVVDVSPDATRVILASPPAGSTPVMSGGSISYDLPPGATGESFTYPSLNSSAAELPTTAVYGPSTTAAPSETTAAAGPTCVITAYKPGNNGGQGTMRGTTFLDCTGSGAEATQVRVQSTLYSGSLTGGPWTWRGYARSPWDMGSAVVTMITACTRGDTYYWKTRADGSTIYEGLQVSYTDTSAGIPVPCT